MIQHLHAWKLKRGDRLQLGRRVATVQRVINMEIADLLPEDCRPYAQKGEILEIEIFLNPGIRSLAFDDVLINHWRIHRDPADLVQMAD